MSSAFSRAQQRHAAAGDDAFFQRGLRGRLGVFEQRLALLHFGFGRGADVDLRHAAGQLGQPLLQLLAVVSLSVFSISRRICSARPSIAVLLAGAADDRRVLVRDR